MKNILIKVAVFVIAIAVVAVLFFSSGAVETKRYVYKGNTEHKAINIKPGTYQCSQCNMDIEDMNYAAQIVTKDGDTYFFDDIGCAVLWLDKDTSRVARIFTKHSIRIDGSMRKKLGTAVRMLRPWGTVSVRTNEKKRDSSRMKR